MLVHGLVIIDASMIDHCGQVKSTGGVVPLGC